MAMSLLDFVFNNAYSYAIRIRMWNTILNQPYNNNRHNVKKASNPSFFTFQLPHNNNYSTYKVQGSKSMCRTQHGREGCLHAILNKEST